MSLFEGAQSGNLALVRHALATEGQDDLVEYVNRRNIVGERPLHLASKNQDVRLFACYSRRVPMSTPAC